MSATDGVGYFCVVHEREATKPVTISGDALAATANFTTRTRTPPIYPTSKAIFLPFLQPSKIRFNDPPIIFRSGIRFARRIEQLPCPPSSSPPLEIDIRPGQQLVFLRKQEILAFFLSRHLYKLFSRPSRVLKLSKLSRRREKRGEGDA